MNSYFIPHTSKEERMPIVRPPRDLSKVKSVKKYKTRNGEVVHELVVLFDYVRKLKPNIFDVRYLIRRRQASANLCCRA